MFVNRKVTSLEKESQEQLAFVYEGKLNNVDVYASGINMHLGVIICLYEQKLFLRKELFLL